MPLRLYIHYTPYIYTHTKGLPALGLECNQQFHTCYTVGDFYEGRGGRGIWLRGIFWQMCAACMQLYAWVRHSMTDKNRPLGESKRCFQSHFLQKETRMYRSCTALFYRKRLPQQQRDRWMGERETSTQWLHVGQRWVRAIPPHPPLACDKREGLGAI
jgi:hypothetical protein